MSKKDVDDMRPPLMLTKLKAPADFGNLLVRQRLIDKLTHGMHYRVTLIHGAAGFGKTSLALQWRNFLVAQGATVAWLSIDAEDNDAERCIKHIIKAIHLAAPTIDINTIALSKNSSEQTIKVIFTKLINKIETLNDAVYLIIDDWHLLHDEKLQTSLTFLIEHAPEHFHLVICSRSQPSALPLATLRVKNQLLEINSSDLRFNKDESSAFLRELNQLELKTKDVHTLWQKTEGWAASLQLILLILRANNSRKEIVNISNNLGRNHSISEYLAENVLNSLSPETIDFLLQTAILQRLNGDLCNAVTQRTDSQSTLRTLYQQGLFIRPLDQEQQWFQYHHLFARFLQRRLKQSNRPSHWLNKMPCGWLNTVLWALYSD